MRTYVPYLVQTVLWNVQLSRPGHINLLDSWGGKIQERPKQHPVLTHLISSIKINIKPLSYQAKAGEPRGHSDTGSLVSPISYPLPLCHTHPQPMLALQPVYFSAQSSKGSLCYLCCLSHTEKEQKDPTHTPILQLLCILFSFSHPLWGWKGALEECVSIFSLKASLLQAF